MSRHRNVRSMNYEDEYYDEDDVYGHSVEDNYCISPGTAAQFTYNRDHNVALSNFMGEQGGIPEEEEGEDTDEGTPRDQHRSSLDYTRPKLSEVDEAKLNSVLEEVRNVLGEAVPEGMMVDTILRRNFSVEGTLNELLTQQEAPKPQREPRRDRRNRSQELDDEIDTGLSDSLQDNVFSYIPDTTGGVMKFGASVSPKSPLLVMKSVPVNKKDSVIVTRQCAFVSRPPNVASDKDCKDVIGSVVADLSRSKKTDQFSHDKPPGLPSQGKLSVLKSNNEMFSHELCTKSLSEVTDPLRDSKVDSQFQVHREARENGNVNIKLSLSTLAEEHGIKNRGVSGLPSEDKSHKVMHMTGKPVSLSDLARHNKDPGISSDQTRQKTDTLTGLSLASLAKSHQTTAPSNEGLEVKAKLTLSDLAQKHCGSNGSSDKMLSRVSTSSNAAENNTNSAINTTVQPVDSPTSESNKSQNKASSSLNAVDLNISKNTSITTNKVSSPLANLATAHLHNAQNQSSVQNLSTALNPSSKQSKPPACSTSQSSVSSPLSTTSKSLSASSTGKSPMGLSLSQLAAAHGVKRSPLSTAGKEINIPDREENQDNKYQKQVSIMSLDMFKNKSDKDQIILSLSTLIDKHNQKETQVIVTQHASSVNRPDVVKLGGPSLKTGKENVDTEGIAASFPPKINVSLADLAKSKNQQAPKETKMKNNNLVENVGQVTNAVRNNEVGRETVDVPRVTGKDNIDLEDVFEDKLKLTDDVKFEMVKHLVNGPSDIGNTLCLGIRVKKARKYKSKKFCYSCQLKGVKEKFHVELSQVKPFDFSTPSPDDVVKAKQKQAFNRSGT